MPNRRKERLAAGRTACAFIDGASLSLAGALQIAPGEVVALVGAGGKTSGLFQLAAELAASGGRVLVTTTTHIFPPTPQQCSAVIIENDLPTMLTAARAALAANSIVTVARALNPDGRLAGIDPAWAALLREQLPVTNLLIEADGSKGRPFKAPAAHEPVIPACTDLVVPVVGLSAIGRPLSERTCHRPARIAELASVSIDETIIPAVVAAVLCHPEGSTRGAPATARVVPLLNQADDETRISSGRAIACELIHRGMVRVVIAALRASPPVRELAVKVNESERWRTVSAIVLAAGLGQRMGKLKLALPLGEKSLLRHVIDAALASPVDEVIVVLGHGAAELERDLPRDRRVRAVHNPAFAEGQSSSIRVGINALHRGTDAVVFLLGDQPLIAPQTIARIIDIFAASGAPIVQPFYRGTPGHPVLFARKLFPELLAVTGDQGGREVLARHRHEAVTANIDADLPRDIDTIEDYEGLAATIAEQPQVK